MKTRLVVPGLVFALGACTTASVRSSKSASDESAPVVTAVDPDTIPLGRGAVPVLVISGTGFVPGGTPGGFADGNNTLQVGRATFERVAADSSGTTIRFSLPLTYVDTALKGRPASFAPGEYAVSVRNARGTSNAITLTMIR
jgi:hypothetical protein